MSRRGRNGGAVRGPSSALTSFLAGLGVQPSVPLTTWGNTSQLQGQDGAAANGDAGDAANDDGHHVHLAHDGPVLDAGEALDPAGAVTARTVEAGPSNVGEGTPEDDGMDSDALDAPPKKRRRARSADSDDLDAPSGTATPAGAASTKDTSRSGTASAVARQPLKRVGEFMQCGECGKRFTVTVYTKEHPTHAETWLCVDCCYALGMDPFAKAKKKAAPKKEVAKKEARNKIVHYEERKGAAPLGDTCIGLIGKCIEDVDQLGDIGGVNLDKVCKIISKSRRLTPETATLFYSPDRSELSMYDCTRLVHESYLTLARLCPNLTSLSLQLCGQLHTDSVTDWGTSLPHLERLELFAPFLVRKEGWLAFFRAVGSRLKGFLITQSPRFDLECLEALVESCPNLTELRLCEVGKLKDDFLPVIAKLEHLELLNLSSLPDSLGDDAVVELIGAVGAGLVDLDLSDNSDLTDAILAPIADCTALRRLALRHVDLTDGGLADFFGAAKSPGFTHLDLEKGHELGSGALAALIQHSAHSLVELSLLGWKDAGADELAMLGQCKKLEKLNLGWCRQVNDFTMKDILDGCDSIKEIRVWGCNQLTDAVPRKKGVKVIGIETHSI